MIIVVVTTGKHEDIETAMVRLFSSIDKAHEFIRSKNTGWSKYWTKAEIVSEGETLELSKPKQDT